MSASLLNVEDLVGLPERVEEVMCDVPARSLAFNFWGTLLAAGCQGGAVAVYDYQTRGLAATLQNGHASDSDVTAVLWSADGRTLVSGASDGSLAAWDVSSSRLKQRLTLPGGGSVIKLAWLDSGSKGCLQEGHRQPQVLPQQNELLVSMDSGPAQLLCLSSGRQQQLPVVCIDQDGKQAGTSEGPWPSGQVAVPSLDGAIIYAGTRGALLVLRRHDLALLDVIRVDGGPRILGLHLHPNGRRLLVTSSDQHIRMYLLHRPGDRQLTRAQQRLTRAAGSTGFVQQQTQPQPAEAWPVHSLEEALRAAAAAPRHLHNSLFYDDNACWMSWHLDFKSNENSRRPWKCAALSPDGEYFASAQEGAGHVLYLWEAGSEARINSVLEGQGIRDAVQALCWHPNSTPMQLLALNSAGSVYVWAKAFTENWSAFAPDFAELDCNHEYVEPEDEFDMNPRPQDEPQHQIAHAGSMVQDDEDIDIGTPQAQQREAMASLGVASDGLLPLVHLPLAMNDKLTSTPKK